jgi:plasmid stability protein
VLLSIEEYTRLRGKEQSIAEALAMKGGEDIEFDPARLNIELRIPDLS